MLPKKSLTSLSTYCAPNAWHSLRKRVPRPAELEALIRSRNLANFG